MLLQELFFFDWGRREPFLQVGVVGPDGTVTRSAPVDLPGPRIQHDLALTDTHVVVFDLAMSLDAGRRGQPTIGFMFDDEAPCRIGLIDRSLESALRWSDIDP